MRTQATIAALAGSLSLTGGALAAELKLIGSPGVRGAVSELAPQFEKQTGHRVRSDFVVIAVIKRRIVKQGKVAADAHAPFGRTGIGLAVRKGAPRPDISTRETVDRRQQHRARAGRRPRAHALPHRVLGRRGPEVPRPGTRPRLSMSTLVRRALLPCAALILAACSADRQQQETHYMTYTAAKIEGAVHKGWVPDWLPANANTLKEKHTPSSGQSILQFAFPPSDKWTPPASCARVEPAAARRPALTAAWWPKDMPPAGYVVHACNGAREYLAVDFPRGEALYWQP